MRRGSRATSRRCASARGYCATGRKTRPGSAPSKSSWRPKESRSRRRGEPPLLLLDEVAAHLDAARRTALFEVLAGLESQAWITGTDAALFAPLSGAARFLTVRDGALSSTVF